jgi:hypothetical protein
VDEKIDNGRDRREVQAKKNRDGFQGNRRRLADVVVEETGDCGQHQVGDEPRNRFARALCDQHADRREQRPQHDSARGDVAPDAPLHDEGHKQKHGDLNQAEKREIFVLEKERKRSG